MNNNGLIKKGPKMLIRGKNVGVNLSVAERVWFTFKTSAGLSKVKSPEVD